MIFYIPRNPYDSKTGNLFKKSSLELEESSSGSVYCLVGCNGSGKSTIIEFMQQQLKKSGAFQIRGRFGDFNAFQRMFEDKQAEEADTGVAFYSFDKHTNDAHSEEDSLLSSMFEGFSSTGEGIIQRLGKGLSLIHGYITKPKVESASPLSLWIFFDDCDAGTSIDMIRDIKKVLKLIKRDCVAAGITLTVVLSANSYEMCRTDPDSDLDIICINAWDFSRVEFGSYEEYCEFVLKSRKQKEVRRCES